jgi:hypothetical protein
VGYKIDLSVTTSLFSDISYLETKGDDGDGEYNNYGYEVNVGVKHNVSKVLEAGFGIEHIDLGYYRFTSLLVNVSYEIYNDFDIYAEGTVLSNNYMYSAGFRYNF